MKWGFESGDDHLEFWNTYEFHHVIVKDISFGLWSVIIRHIFSWCCKKYRQVTLFIQMLELGLVLGTKLQRTYLCAKLEKLTDFIKSIEIDHILRLNV